MPPTTDVGPTALIAGGALVVVNHSGGKDSQALLIHLLPIVPRHQLLVMHASLGEMEWPGAMELARDQASAAGVAFRVARAEKSLLDMVERRFAARPDVPSWPSAKHRQCTSDLKRDPIAREVRAHLKESGHTVVISAMGLRAQESASRAKRATFSRNERNSIAGRDWYEWSPIHDWTTLQVFETIRADGQQPHKAYAQGNDRLSCIFCIFGSKEDLKNGAKHNPALARQYIEMESRTGYTMHMSRKSLSELIQEAA